MLLWLQSLLGSMKKEDGQGMVEYALLIGLIAIVVVAVLLLLGPAIVDLFQDIINTLTNPEGENEPAAFISNMFL